jgi:hemerythrin-like metal-binding protein
LHLILYNKDIRMRIFDWTAAHAVHVPEVDEEHRQIFRLCDDLERAMMAGAPASGVQAIVDDLVIHTAKHLAHEEHEMRAAGYPLYAWHHRQHHTARIRIKALNRRIRRGDREAVLDLLEFLSSWLSNHIRLADRMLGAYLRNCQRAASALLD